MVFNYTSGAQKICARCYKELLNGMSFYTHENVDSVVMPHSILLHVLVVQDVEFNQLQTTCCNMHIQYHRQMKQLLPIFVVTPKGVNRYSIV